MITVLKKVNDSYTIFDIGPHPIIRNTFLKSYESFGIKELKYEPTIFDSGSAKFVWVRQIYSGIYSFTNEIKKKLEVCQFNLSKFYYIINKDNAINF